MQGAAQVLLFTSGVMTSESQVPLGFPYFLREMENRAPLTSCTGGRDE